MVQTADGTIGWVFGGYLADTPAAATGTYDYAKILKGDLSDFAGTWTGVGDGAKKQLRADGTFNNGEKATGFQRVDNSPVASGVIYMWGIHIPDEGGYGVMLFPAGVDVKFGGGIYQTDKTKVRISMGQDFDPSGLYYRN